MKTFFLIITLTIGCLSFGQQKNFKQRTNHVVHFGLTNSMFWNNVEGINDVANYSKKQFVPGIEALGYLFSYEINKNFEMKVGYTHISTIRNFVTYLGNTSFTTVSNPHFSFLIDYKPFPQKDLFLSYGIKITYFPFDISWTNVYETSLAQKSQITFNVIKGINPMITFGIGKRRILFNKYRIEWLFSYNHGTKSLRNYEFIRFDPYIISNLKSYNHHISFSLRYYFKKYAQDNQ